MFDRIIDTVCATLLAAAAVTCIIGATVVVVQTV